MLQGKNQRVYAVSVNVYEGSEYISKNPQESSTFWHGILANYLYWC